MHVARPATSRANGKPPGKVCFSAGGKRCRLFMPDMNPLQLFLFSNRVCKPIEGVTRKPINPFHSRLNECIYHQLRDVFSHFGLPSRCRVPAYRESLDKKSSSSSPSYVSAPAFNTSFTRACVTSLATLKSDSWASTRSHSARELNAPLSTAALA